jgi:hypothetical protein
LAVKILVWSWMFGEIAQQCSTRGRNPSCSIQQFSNLKIFPLGISVFTSITQG